MGDEKFFTFNEYMRSYGSLLSASEEDYIEMIFRLCKSNNGYTRVVDISQALNVKPPSVTNMIRRLILKDLLIHKDYGTIELTKTGKIVGKMLLERHETVAQFLDLLNIKDDQLKQTEIIEHTISPETLEALKDLVHFFKDNTDILRIFNEYRKL